MSEDAPNMPQNCDQLRGNLLEIEEIGVYAWTPQRDGKGKCTQVHLHIKLRTDDAVTMVTRFKSPRAINEFILALQKHRNDVWPEAPRV